MLKYVLCEHFISTLSLWWDHVMMRCIVVIWHPHASIVMKPLWCDTLIRVTVTINVIWIWFVYRNYEWNRLTRLSFLIAFMQARRAYVLAEYSAVDVVLGGVRPCMHSDLDNHMCETLSCWACDQLNVWSFIVSLAILAQTIKAFRFYFCLLSRAFTISRFCAWFICDISCSDSIDTYYRRVWPGAAQRSLHQVPVCFLQYGCRYCMHFVRRLDEIVILLTFWILIQILIVSEYSRDHCDFIMGRF